MAAGRTGSTGDTPPSSEHVDATGEVILETMRADAFSGGTRGVVDMHRVIAMRLLREGNPARAFTELVRASRTVPMNARLAATITFVALKAGTTGPALTLLSDGVNDVEGDERLAVMRVLARLLRRTNELERCREILAQVLAARPADRRARFVFNALLEREQRWEELDASLERETKEALRRTAYRTASRIALRRARVQGERLQDSNRASLRYGQAAQYAEQGGDAESAFLLRLLWVRGLHQSGGAPRQLDDAVRLLLESGERVDKGESARALVRELGITPLPERARVVSVETERDVATTIGPPPQEREQPTTIGAPPEQREKPTAVGPRPEREKPTAIGPAPERRETPPASKALPRRHSTQLELMAVAEAAEKVGKRPEIAAILAAAVQEGPGPQAHQKLEAHYIGRAAWRELAQFYRDVAAQTQNKAERGAWLEKLAELLEDELHDPKGAALAWAEVVATTGDSQAVKEQVRLLGKDATGLRGALDAGVEKAADATERARALVLRAEEALTRREVAGARGDFEAALALVPLHPAAAAGLAELAAMQGDYAPIRALEKALTAVPKKTAGRGDLYRRLARLSESPLRDVRLAKTAWVEVLAELQGDEEATRRIATIARAQGDDALLETLLQGFLTREPRGARARHARIELVALMERKGRADDAVNALREAVRVEPGHQEAWLALSERLLAREQHSEAAWALEHGAAATAEPLERLRLWLRLARFCREHLNDEERAQTCDARAEKLRRELTDELPSGPLGGPLMVPRPRGQKPAPAMRPPEDEEDFEEIASALEARFEPEAERVTPASVSLRLAKRMKLLQPFETPVATVSGEVEVPTGETSMEDRERTHGAEPLEPVEAEPAPAKDVPDVQTVAESPSVEEDVLEVGTGDFEVLPEPEARASPPAESRPIAFGPRETQELAPVELGDPSVPVPPSFGPSPSKALSAERVTLFERVRASPLDPEGYRLLAEHFDTASDATRSSLMLEIARALEGDPHAAPRTPRLILSATDRAGLKHPSVRGETGELMGLVGVALCRLHPARGRDAGSGQEFHLDSGKGARPAADALLAAVRILGQRAPDVFLSEDAGPPFSLVYAMEPRLLVGRLAVKKALPDAELRFFAGRALFTQHPELMALRSLRRDQVQNGLKVVVQVLQGRPGSPEGRVVKDALPARAVERLRELWAKTAKRIDLAQLSEGARHSANRAGLVVCGGIAPAVAALRAKKALPSEMIELVRFAASERYLQMRGRTLRVKKD